MPISFTDKFNIDAETFQSTGAFDVILDVDSRLFIDPALLELCTSSEFIGCKQKVKKYFRGIITLVDCSKSPDDRFWKRAGSLLTFKEISGTCFGYSKFGTKGNAIGKIYRQMILISISQLIEAGLKDPTIFELLGVFQEGIGCDRISDLLTYILLPDILNFTQRVVTTFNLDNMDFVHNGVSYRTIMNESNNKPLLLLPKSILTPLPVAESYDDIDRICMENQRVRNEIYAYFDFGNRKKISKKDVFGLIKDNIPFREALLSAYNSAALVEYDFEKDPAGEYIWYATAKKYVTEHPLKIEIPEFSTLSGVIIVVKIICAQFKRLIEDNNLWELLYNDKNEPKHERAAQQLFFGIADAYCTTHNIDLTREPNAGRGAVDFKLSKGSCDKVVVEVKLTSNKQLFHGIETQLPIYMRQEKTTTALYLIIDTGHEKALKKFKEFYKEIGCTIPYYIIDATPPKSASKA